MGSSFEHGCTLLFATTVTSHRFFLLIIVSKDLQRTVFVVSYASVTCVHMGGYKTVVLIRVTCYFTHMRKEILE